MKLSLEQIAAITQGAARVTEENGRICFDRFTRAEGVSAHTMALARCSAGIRLSFMTDASCLRLAVHTEEALPIRSYFSFEIFENGQLLGEIRNFTEGDAHECYPDKVFPVGVFRGEFPLQAGEKQVDIYFPHSVIGSIEELTLVRASFLRPVKKEKRLVAYGDSITQGFDALHPSRTYAALLAEHLDSELVNKGIGGAIFTPALATAAEGQADYIVVAYGCNDWDCCGREEFRENATAFLAAVKGHYRDAKITVITPIWRQDHDSCKPFGPFRDVQNILIEFCKGMAGVQVVSGWELVKQTPAYFGDGKVHPNEEGFRQYIQNLTKQL